MRLASRSVTVDACSEGIATMSTSLLNVFGAPPTPTHERQPRVFLSHRRPDKDIAREIAMYFEQLGLYYYFDEQDVVFERMLACGHTEAGAIVEAIDDGLRHCSHLLGVLSMQTMGSWWVPYEIGGARARGHEIAHVIVDEVDLATLPEFIRIAPNVTSADALFGWAKSIARWPESFVRRCHDEWWAEEGGGIFQELGPGEEAVDEWFTLAERRNRTALDRLEASLQGRRGGSRSAE